MAKKYTVQQYRGPKANLPTSEEDGQLVITTDEKSLYLGQGSGNTMIKLGQVEEYSSLASFPAAGFKGKIYMAADTGILYKYDDVNLAYTELFKTKLDTSGGTINGQLEVKNPNWSGQGVLFKQNADDASDSYGLTIFSSPNKAGSEVKFHLDPVKDAAIFRDSLGNPYKLFHEGNLNKVTNDFAIDGGILEVRNPNFTGNVGGWFRQNVTTDGTATTSFEMFSGQDGGGYQSSFNFTPRDGLNFKDPYGTLHQLQHYGNVHTYHTTSIGDQIITAGTYIVPEFNDWSTDWDGVNHKYIVPQDGDYEVSAFVSLEGVASGDLIAVRVADDSGLNSVVHWTRPNVTSGLYSFQISRLIPNLVKGTGVWIRVYSESGATFGNLSYFNIKSVRTKNDFF